METQMQALELILNNIMSIKIKRVGEDKNETATLKDLEDVFYKQSSEKPYLDLISKGRAYFIEDYDYALYVIIK